MYVIRIVEGLERLKESGPKASAAARLGFLEWAFGSPGVVTAQTAKDALAAPEVKNASSPAARAFVGYLRDATRQVSRPQRRRRMH